MKKYIAKIVLPTVLSMLLFILSIFFVIIPWFQQSIINGKKEMIKELTNAAWSILVNYEKDEKAGVITKEEAQKTAVSRIQYLRYGEEAKDYFWITDMKPRMIMHPHRIDLNGKDLNSFTDPHGKHMFVEFVKTARSNGHGYVDYMWQWKDDSTKIVPKLSYVMLFKPWGWIIGTGIYIEDVKRDMQILTRRLTMISFGISLLLALLLFYILKQSIDTERKRLSAENLLHETKEKYRTMVEAATEGLLMLVDGKISFANPVLKKIVGYETEDLVGKSMHEIFCCEDSSSLPDMLQAQKLNDGQFEMTLMKKDGTATDVLVTISTTKNNGQDVNIVILKDLSYTKVIPISGVDFQRFARQLGVGYFKMELDGHGRFVFANEMAIRLMGHADFAELSRKGFVDLLANQALYKDIKERINQQGFAKNIRMHVVNGTSASSVLRISLVVDSSLDTETLTCDGIVEDITLEFYEQQARENAIAMFKAPSLVLQAPVSHLLSKVFAIDSMSTILYANSKFEEWETSCLLVVDSQKYPLGVVTLDDFRHRVVALSLKPDNPVYMIMSAPIKSCFGNDRVDEAMNRCNQLGISHLMVLDSKRAIVGVFRSKDVCDQIYQAGEGLITRVKHASTLKELKSAHQGLQQVLLPLIKGGIHPRLVFAMASGFSDAMIVRAIELAIQEQGKPPVPFAFVCLGSEGRQEETLLTDQDNALVYANVQGENASQVQNYFNMLAQKVCKLLHLVGYTYCHGNIMAQNPQYCLPVDAWKKQFLGWINTPDAKNILEASVFFDLRTVYGDASLTQVLHETIAEGIQKQALFLYHMALNSANVKLPQLASGTLLHDKTSESFDLKQAIAPITMLVRSYALRHKLLVSNTFKRMEVLQELKVLSHAKVAEMLVVYEFLMKLRLQNQADLLQGGFAITNLLNSKKMTELELATLKKALAQIHDFQEGIKADFRITT